MSQDYYPSQDPIFKFKKEMKLRKFSPKTIKSYLQYITNLLESTNKNPKTVTSDDIRNYLENMANRNLSASSLNIAHSTFKLYFEKILCRRFILKLPITIYKPSKVRWTDNMYNDHLTMLI